MIRRTATGLLIVLALLAAAAPLAQADALSVVQDAYTATGSVPPCQFSSSLLVEALKQAPTYDTEYTDISQAIQTALSERAAGACGGAASGVHVAGGHGTVPPGLRGLRVPAAVTGPGDGAIPAPLLIVLGLAAACAAVGIAYAAGRARGWDPLWARTTRHAFGDAEFHLGLRWENLRDRLPPRARR